MSTPVTIRQAAVEDAQTIAEVHVHSWQWAYRGLFPDHYLESLSIGEGADAHRRRIASETEGRTWVAEHQGRIVGFATTGPSRDPDASPQTGEIGAIYLRHDATGKDIGRALQAHAVHDLWQRGYEQATLWVLESNVRARRFYEKAGWITDGTTKTEDLSGASLHQIRYRAHVRPEYTESRVNPTRS